MANKKSLIVLLVCYAFMLAVAFLYYPKWEKSGTEATIGWDVSGYYMYLPAVFIYKDLKQCRFKDDILYKYGPTPDFQQAFKHDSGNYVMKYSCGQAIQFAPFFAIAHIYASQSEDYETDGFSLPYQFMISMGSLIVMCIGLWFLRLILLEYFDDRTTALTLISIALATNYFDYSVITGAMTHNYLFMWYAVLIYLTIHFYRKPKYLNALAIGCVLGIMALTRPTEIMAAFIPLFWGCKLWDKDSIVNRFNLFKIDKGKYLLAILACFIIGSIQLIYWKYSSGEWIVYSYEDQGFSFLQPHILDGLFSYRSGWLVYSPIMFLSLVGFYFLYKSYTNIFSAIAIFSLLFIYLTFAWDIWWYGGALGQRAMVQSYPVFAFSLAAFISTTLSKKYLKFIFSGFLVMCIHFNIWWTHQAHLGGLLKAGQMTKAYFWKVLGAYEHNISDLKLLDTDDEFLGLPQDFETINEDDFSALECAIGNDIVNGVLCLNRDLQYSPKLTTSPPLSKEWIRAEADFTINEKEWEFWRMTQFVVEFVNKEKLVESSMIRIQRLMQPEQTKHLYIDVKIPDKEYDQISVYFWNADGSIPIFIDNLKVSSFNG